MLNTEIKQQQQIVAELRKQLEVEEQKANEMKAAEVSLLKAESYLKQAIAQTDSLPQWLKEKFWETFKAEVKDALQKGDRDSGLMLDLDFYWLRSIIEYAIATSTVEDDSHYIPGDLTFDEQNASWHINVHSSSDTVCRDGVVLTMLSICPTAEERMASVKWLGKFKNWTWGIDTQSTWYQELTSKLPSLMDLLASVGKLCQSDAEDCERAIAEEQMIYMDDLEKKFSEIDSHGIQSILKDLWESNKIVFMDENKNDLHLQDWEDLSLDKAEIVCYKNFVSSKVVSIGKNNQRNSLDSDFNSDKTVDAGLFQSSTQSTEKENPLKIQVVPKKGIKWEEDGLPCAFSHGDFANKTGYKHLTDYKRGTLKAIASYMGLSDKGKMKRDIWDRIRAEYLDLCNSRD